MSELLAREEKWSEAENALTAGALADGSGEAEQLLFADISALRLRRVAKLSKTDDTAVDLLRETVLMLEQSLPPDPSPSRVHPARAWLGKMQYTLAERLRDGGDIREAQWLMDAASENYARAAREEVGDPKAKQTHEDSAHYVSVSSACLLAEVDGLAALERFRAMARDAKEGQDDSRVPARVATVTACASILSLLHMPGETALADFDESVRLYESLPSWNPFASLVDGSREILRHESARIALKSELDRRLEEAVAPGDRRRLVDALREVYKLRAWPLEPASAQGAKDANQPYLHVTPPIQLEFAKDVLSEAYVTSVVIPDIVSQMRARILGRFGVKIPGIKFRAFNDSVGTWVYAVRIMDVVREQGALPLGDRESEESRAAWLLGRVEHLLERSLPLFVGHQETQNLLEEAKLYKTSDEIVFTETATHMDPLTKIIRALLAERVPIVRFKRIYQTFLDLGGPRASISAVCHAVRRLPEIRPRLWGNDPTRIFATLEDDLVNTLADSIRLMDRLPMLVIRRSQRAALASSVRAIADASECLTLVVSHEELRPLLRAAIAPQCPEVPVLSSRELVVDIDQRNTLVVRMTERAPTDVPFEAQREPTP
jgi:hypothetical protein